MNYCVWIWHVIGVLSIAIWNIMSSPTVIAAILAPYFAIKIYLNQQRVSRIQRIYYEESLLDQLKHLDNSIDITIGNIAYFENAINLILNDFRVLRSVTADTIMSLNEIANKIKSPTRYQSSKREVLIILFKKYGYIIHQWLFKYDQDFSNYNSYIKEVIFGLATKLQVNTNLEPETIALQTQEIHDNYKLIMRHYVFAYFFNQLVSRVGTLDFKSQKALITNIAKDLVISSTLSKIDRVFKILFGYFKIDDKTFLSYLEDEKGDRFKFHVNERISLERVKETPPFEAQLRIIKNDLRLANLKVEVNNLQKNYSLIQTGIANLCAFDEKPKFYPEAESFDNFQ